MKDVLFAQLVTLQGAAESGPGELDPLQLILEATWVVQLVIVLLVAMSLGTWFVVGAKMVRLGQASRESVRFLSAFWANGQQQGWTPETLEGLYTQAKGLVRSPLAQLFRAGYVELARISNEDRADEPLEAVERAVRRASTAEITRLESMLPFLATTGSTAPFIGLFGTVWGIMHAFWNIGAQQNASLDVVAPGIAEALIATAIGLVAAIPAVMAYNTFLRRLRVLEAELEAFGADFLNIARRHYL
ncbi:MAG: protein TolQ [Sandaracinaceae bacterium]